GVSFALSLGNMTGYDENDVLEYAMHDEQTKVIAIYLESLTSPQTFLTLAAELSHSKPIFLLKGGTTKEGSQAALSHTAALATSQVLLDSLCLQAGIVQVANFEQLVRASVGASKSHYLPDNLLIVTNAGGPGVVLTDEIIKAGIPMSRPPLDLLGDATPADFEQALSTQDLSLDTIVVIVTQQAVTDMAGITKVLTRKRGKHLLFVCLAGGDEQEIYRTQLKQSGVIVTRYPNEIAETLELLYKAKLAQNQAKFSSLTVAGQTRPFPISYQDTVKLLEDYDFKTPKSIIITSKSDLPKLADLTYPLIAKTTNLEIKHKGKIGAVILDLIDASTSLAAYQKLTQWGSDVVFQEKIKTGVEVLLGAHHDPVWGWYLAVGLGGSLSDTYDDRIYLFLPVDATQIRSVLHTTKLVSLLNESQTKFLIEGILKFACLVLETKGLNEFEINPLFVTKDQLIAADLKRS
ncbi:MAG: acetate--CoA ligase family protein, partial [Microgenomates group bacterium]